MNLWLHYLLFFSCHNHYHSNPYMGLYHIVNINYLKMVESVGEQVNIDNKNDHILKYVLNDLIVREICTYIGPNYSK